MIDFPPVKFRFSRQREPSAACIGSQLIYDYVLEVKQPRATRAQNVLFQCVIRHLDRTSEVEDRHFSRSTEDVTYESNCCRNRVMIVLYRDTALHVECQGI